MLACLLAGLLLAGPAPAFVKDPAELGIPFDRFTTVDAHGRTIVGYLSKLPKEAAGKKLPIILFIQGSGSQSLWVKRGERVGGGMQNLLLQLAKGQARILCVEKPGVKYLDWPSRPGSAQDSPKEFREEHTLPRWGEANAAALRAAWTLPDIEPAKTLVIGHSEGGIVAARVAAECPAVTHVAPLGCGGVTQLFSLAELARRRAPEGQGAAAMEQVYAEWAKVLAKPDSVDDYWMGHPHRRWSTFLRHSVIDELKRTKAKVYLAHGTADEADSVFGFDAMRAELLAHGRDVTAQRVEGGDHGFSTTDQKGQGDGMGKVFGAAVEWFLK